mmetsp:Transcript_16592/g.24822  ORF Transcript_16592/g.24822 Transcript_16592/m.24822 type:complete len:312 (+) Transcript_16592:415-1350(+)
MLNIALNLLTNRKFTGALTNLSKISSSEFISLCCQIGKINFLGYRRLAKSGTQDSKTSLVIRHGNVDQLIKTSRTHECSIDNVWTVCSSNNENILLCANSIHFSKKLVHDTICCSTSISAGSSTLLSNRIQLIKEEYTRRCLSCLLKYIANISLTLSKPHCKKFGSLDRDEVRLTLIGNRLCHEGLTTSRRPVKKDSLAGIHTELLKFLWMLDRILNEFLEVTLDVLQTTNIIPTNVRNLDNGLTQTRWVRNTQCMSKVILTDCHGIQDLSINRLILNINQVHFFSDTLHGSFSTKSSNISSNKPMSLPRN